MSSLALNEEIIKSPLFDLPKRPAYGLTVALRKGNSDMTFQALNSVCKATIGLITRLNNVTGENIIPFVWPVIVINAQLFEAFLDNEGNLKVEQIEKGLLIWKNPMIRKHTFVQIYTKKKFKEEAKDINQWAVDFLKLVNEENDRSPRKKKDR